MTGAVNGFSAYESSQLTFLNRQQDKIGLDVLSGHVGLMSIWVWRILILEYPFNLVQNGLTRFHKAVHRMSTSDSKYKARD